MFTIRQITLVAEWNIRLSTDLQWLVLQFMVLSLWRREVINARVSKAYTNTTVDGFEFKCRAIIDGMRVEKSNRSQCG